MFGFFNYNGEHKRIKMPALCTKKPIFGLLMEDKKKQSQWPRMRSNEVSNPNH